MDRRTQLAVVLIALVLGANLTYTAYHQKKNMALEQQHRAVATAESLAAHPAPVSAAAAPAGISGAASGALAAAPALTPAPAVEAVSTFPLATAADGEYSIETPLQTLRFSRTGGVLTEVSLHEYKMFSGGLVNLVPPPPPGDTTRHALGLQVATPQGSRSLDAARFDAAPGDFDAAGVLRLAAGSGPRTIALRCDAGGAGAVVKRITVDPSRYDFEVGLEFETGAALPRVDSYTLEWTTGMPFTESNSKEDETRIRASADLDGQLVRKRALDFRKEESQSNVGTIRWANLQSKYFMVGLIPAKPFAGTAQTVGQAKTHWVGVRLTNPMPGHGSETFRVYAGPIIYDKIRDLGVGLEATIELGYRWIRPISSALVHFIAFLNRFIPNYGIVIILVSVLAKLLFWPLTERSFRSMRRMQEMQPRMEEIRRRYKDDPKGMNEQMMRMYKEQKINPVGGCIPMVVQMPMFFALFSALQSSIQLRNAPFFGWIDNLAGPDVLFTFPATLPFIGNHFSLLPLLMGGSMMWQSHLTPAAATGGGGGGAMAQQQMMMKWFMPIMMMVLFYKMPSGLVIYWIVSTMMSVWQQTHINRKFGRAPVLGVVNAKPEGRSPNAGPNGSNGEKSRGSSGERSDRTGGPSR